MWRPQVYFALAAALLLFLALWGGALVPDFFRRGAAGQVLGLVSFFCFAGAAYFSLRSSLRNGRYHAVNALILAACIAALAGASWYYLWANRTAARLVAENYRQGERRAELLADLVREALQNSDPQGRKKCARAAARVFGVRLAYVDAAGQFVVYEPTDDDKKEFAGLDEMKGPRDAGLDAVDRTLASSPAIGSKILAWGGFFFLAFFAGDVLRDAWLRRK